MLQQPCSDESPPTSPCRNRCYKRGASEATAAELGRRERARAKDKAEARPIGPNTRAQGARDNARRSRGVAGNRISALGSETGQRLRQLHRGWRRDPAWALMKRNTQCSQICCSNTNAAAGAYAYIRVARRCPLPRHCHPLPCRLPAVAVLGRSFVARIRLISLPLPHLQGGLPGLILRLLRARLVLEGPVFRVSFAFVLLCPLHLLAPCCASASTRSKPIYLGHTRARLSGNHDQAHPFMLITNTATEAATRARGAWACAAIVSVSFRGALNSELKIQKSKRNTLKPAEERNVARAAGI